MIEGFLVVGVCVFRVLVVVLFRLVGFLLFGIGFIVRLVIVNMFVLMVIRVWFLWVFGSDVIFVINWLSWLVIFILVSVIFKILKFLLGFLVISVWLFVISIDCFKLRVFFMFVLVGIC